MPDRVRAKAAAWIGLLQEKGPQLHRPYADMLEESIRELRISHGHLEIRILYFIEGKSVVLTDGFLKKTQWIPKEEIEKAKRCRNEWLKGLEGDG